LTDGSEGREFVLDRRSVQRAFDRAARDYDRSAVLQTRVRNELLDRLDIVRLEPSLVVDLGAGTGHASATLAKRYRSSRVVAVDLAPDMLVVAARQRSWLRRFDRVCADAARLPFRDASVDLVFSNLMLQWCNEPDEVFRECRRVLRPGGLLTYTTFGPDTLHELRRAWSAADGLTHVNRFIDMHDIGDALVRAGLSEPVLDVERYTLTYEDVRTLMRDLKAIGAHNVTTGRAPGLTGRGRMAAMTAAYEEHRSGGKLPATYEVVFGQAWAPLQGPRVRTESVIPVESIGRRPSS